MRPMEAITGFICYKFIEMVEFEVLHVFFFTVVLKMAKSSTPPKAKDSPPSWLDRDTTSSFPT